MGWRARGPAPQYHAHCRVRRHGPARGHLRARSPPRGPGAARPRAVPPPRCAARLPRGATFPSPGVPSPRPQTVPPVPRQCHLSVPRCASCSRAVSPLCSQMCHLLRPPVPPVGVWCRLSDPELTTCPLAMSLLCSQMYHLPVSSATFLSPDAAPALKQHHISVPSCAACPHAASPCPQMCHLPDTSQCHPDHRQRYHLSLTPCMGVQLWPCCHLCPPRMGSASPVEPPAPCAMPLSPMSQT